MQIVRPDALARAKVVLFSPGGNGKTTILGSAQADPRTSPMLVLDFEGGVGSLAGLHIDIAPIRSWEDYNEVYEILESGEHWKLEGSTLKEGETYRSLGIDSVSETHKWALLDILKKEGAARKDPELLEQRDYGKATVQMRRLLRHFRDLPMHVFYTAHAKEVDEPRVGRVKVPDMAGQMAEELVGLMDVVGYLATYEEEEDGEMVTHRTLLLQNFPKYRIKARTPWQVQPPDEIIDPSISNILDVLGYPSEPEGKTTRAKAKAA